LLRPACVIVANPHFSPSIMRITRVETQKKNPSRRSIYADGEYVLGVSIETLLKSGFRTGDEITPDQLKTLLCEEEAAEAKRVALRYLSHRPRTAKEVRDKLRNKEFPDSDISQAIGDLERAGLLNDAEFARMYIRDAIAAKAVGRTLMKRKLLLLGVEKSVVEAALDETFGEVNVEESALEAARKFMRKSTATHKPSDMARLKSRLENFLGRRGFSWDTIAPIVRTLIKEEEE
jgi:regulatory protein